MGGVCGCGSSTSCSRLPSKSRSSSGHARSSRRHESAPAPWNLFNQVSSAGWDVSCTMQCSVQLCF